MGKKIMIIGGGPGGYVCALHAATLGADVTLIEKENLGGTCLNWGCIPSKIMKDSADKYLKILKADLYGIHIKGTIDLDLNAVNNRKKTIIENQKKAIESLLTGNGIHIVKGTASVKSSHVVQVILTDGNIKEYAYDKLIIATGTQPLEVETLPFDHQNILSSNDLLSLDKIPESIVIVGGGVIGCEFACILSALGAKVTIIEGMSRLLPLPSMDEECSKLLLREMKKQKIKVVCDTIVKSSEIIGQGVRSHLDLSPFTDNKNPKKLKNSTLESEKLAVCIGRTPVLKDLGLENIGLACTKNGWIDVNEKMETSVKGVYAIGDILGPQKMMLAHVASHEGMVAAQNAMGNQASMDYRTVPNVVFTMPEIGSVGLSQAQAEETKIQFQAFSVNFRNIGKAHAIGEISGMAKILVETTSHKIIGVHIIGPHASDLIAQATLAIQNKLTVQDIAHTIHAHPTLAEIMGEVALKAIGTPIHG